MGRTRYWTPERVAEAHKIYMADEKISVREIAERHNRTGDPLLRMFRITGLFIRPRGGARFVKRQRRESYSEPGSIKRGEHRHVTVDGECIGCGAAA